MLVRLHDSWADWGEKSGDTKASAWDVWKAGIQAGYEAGSIVLAAAGAARVGVNLLPGRAAVGGTIDPWLVNFTQDTVSWNFSTGQTIGDTANSLRTGAIGPLPPIRVFERAGQLYSLDNRRLLTYRAAGMETPYIRVREAMGGAADRMRISEPGINPVILFP